LTPLGLKGLTNFHKLEMLKSKLKMLKTLVSLKSIVQKLDK